MVSFRIESVNYSTQCVKYFLETLRKYPVLPMLNRTCVKEYQIPGTDKVIEKGVEVIIPVLGVQRDAKYYDEPDKFKPERHNSENTNENRSKPLYLPFGDGPRNCIGMRLGKMQTKVGLVLMLQKFKYELSESHKGTDMEFEPRHFLLQPRSNIYLHVSRR